MQHLTVHRNQLVGEWVFEYIRQFAEKEITPGQKVLLKIEHMSLDYIQAIVKTIEENKDSMSKELELILKTVQKVEGFEQLQTKENETIVWLRNNIAPNQVVVLVLNEERPEGQSLKDAVAVDETALLSKDGFAVLKELLRKYNYLDVSQIEALIRFVECYQSVTDMQLSTLVDFIVQVIKDDETDINVAIAHAYPALSMFKETEVNMANKASFITKLRKNHNLSSLRKSISQLLDVDRLLISTDKFLKTERENQYTSNIWDLYKNHDESSFKQDVEDFLYRKNKNLLQIQFADAEKIFNFKESHKLKDKLINFQQTNQEEYDLRIEATETREERENLEQQKLQDNIEIMDGIEAIEQAKDLDAIRDFREKFEDQLNVANLTKKIQNIENKLENPSLYTDLIEAVLTESLTLLQEIDSEDFKGKMYFDLAVVDNCDISKDFASAVNLHLRMLNSFIDCLNVKLLESNADKATIPEKLIFELQLHVKNDEAVQTEKTRFTFDCAPLNPQNTSFYEFAKSVNEKEKLGYIEIKEDMSALYSFDENLKQLRDKIRITGEDTGLKHIEYFEEFTNEYEAIICKLLNSDYDKDIFADLETVIKTFLAHSYEDIKIVRDIYSLINLMAATQKVDGSGKVLSYKLSVLQPIRLIGYMSRFLRVNDVFKQHLDTSYNRNRILEIKDVKKYREYLLSKLGEVPPVYIANDDSHGIYFLETEQLGEGVYRTNESNVNANDKADIFANEVQKVTNDYLKVYPFSKDSLNILFMYVSNEQYIFQAIDKIFKSTNVSKLNVSIYSKGQASILYKALNQWIQNREEYLIPMVHLGGLPKLEINIIQNNEDEEIGKKIKASLSDYDLAFFVNFLNQSSNSTMQQNFFETPISECEFTNDQWAIYEEIGYINAQGGSRHINYVSDSLPEVLMDFYELQYMINRSTKRYKNDQIQLLKSEITPAKNEANQLYDAMHRLFNWVVAYDKYIDPLFAQQIATQADIIKYSVVQKSAQDIKILISSSENVNRLVNDKDNYYYHDRLANRLMALLGIQHLDTNVKEDIIHTVKKLSGASVLKSLGAGKFTNELLSIYLTLSREQAEQNDGNIHVWFSCDELSWFRTKSKRPDLLHLIIRPDVENKKFSITFRVIELKLVARDSYEAESKDAQIQLNSGTDTLRKIFEFEDGDLDIVQGREDFFEHLMQSRPYTDEELLYMQYLRIGSDWPIDDFIFEQQADVYMYSHDNVFPDKEQVSVGHYRDNYNGLVLNTFTRSYILNALKVSKDEAVEEIENIDTTLNFDEHLKKSAAMLGIEDHNSNESRDSEIADDAKNEDENAEIVVDLNESANDALINVEESEQEVNEEDAAEVIQATPVIDNSVPAGEETYTDNATDSQLVNSNVLVIDAEDANYPEKLALSNLESEVVPLKQRMQKAELLAENYQKSLEQAFRENNVQLRIFDRAIGANIIRMEARIPRTEKASAITSKTREMGLWLKVPTPPIVTVAENIVIDISRVEPDTIYFNEFMEILRKEISAEDIKKKAIVPIGLNPLNKVMYMDLNDSVAHLLVAGATGSGKSVSLNAIVLSMMCLYTPEELKFVFVDPKQVEFSIYEDAKHTEKVITDLEETADYLDFLAVEMDRRYKLFKESFSKNISGYNEYCVEEQKPEERLSRIIVVFDEFADFVLQNPDVAKRIKDTIMRLGQKSRAAGIHLIICTQTPKADIIDTSIRNNLSGRLCLKVADSNASNIVLDESGAELLAGRGDYLMKGNNNKIERGMSPFLDDRTQRALLKYFIK